MGFRDRCVVLPVSSFALESENGSVCSSTRSKCCCHLSIMMTVSVVVVAAGRTRVKLTFHFGRCLALDSLVFIITCLNKQRT